MHHMLELCRNDCLLAKAAVSMETERLIGWDTIPVRLLVVHIFLMRDERGDNNPTAE